MAGHVISPEFNAGEHTDAAALIGTAAPATKSMAEPIYEELGLVRIQRWQGEDLRRPELAGAKLAAAAGARLRAGTGCGARGGHLRGSAAPSWHWEREGMLGLGGGGPRWRRRDGRRREASAMVGNGATARGQLNGEGEAVAELTAVAAAVEVGSGTH